MGTRDLFNRFIAVYMMSNRRHGTIYVGVTSRLPARIGQHREGRIPGFTQDHGLKRLVWYEPHETMSHAIRREKSLKKYRRDWKINLIEQQNPNWDDLFPALTGDIGLPLSPSSPAEPPSHRHPRPSPQGELPGTHEHDPSKVFMGGRDRARP